MPRRRPLLLLAALLLLAGCASTRTGTMGTLPNQEPLVTLLVTEDRDVVADNCRGALAAGRVLGCQVTRTTVLPDGEQVRLIKIVRFTDALPSAMSFEIDLHELCHAVATLQGVADPCHIGNNGLVTTAPRSVQRIR